MGCHLLQLIRSHWTDVWGRNIKPKGEMVAKYPFPKHEISPLAEWNEILRWKDTVNWETTTGSGLPGQMCHVTRGRLCPGLIPRNGSRFPQIWCPHWNCQGQSLGCPPLATSLFWSPSLEEWPLLGTPHAVSCHILEGVVGRLIRVCLICRANIGKWYMCWLNSNCVGKSNTTNQGC